MLVSIIMPAYNAALYIEDSIKSVLNQTYANWELIIINDGSIDNTSDIVQKYALTDSRIRLFNQENKGTSEARNKAITQAKGDWIAFLDSDDLWERNKLERQLEVSYEDPEADVIYTDGNIFRNNDLSVLQSHETRIGTFTGKEMYLIEMGGNILPVLSVIVRRSVIEKIGPQEEYRYCEDYDYWLRMARVGAKFVGLNEKLFYYRMHNNNTSGNILEMQMAEVRILLKNIDLRLIEKKKAFNLLKGKINKLIYHLIQLNKVADALALLKNVKIVFPYLSYNIAYWSIKNFKGKSSKWLKVLLKAE